MKKNKQKRWHSILKFITCFIGALILVDFYYPIGPLVGIVIGWYFGKLLTGEKSFTEPGMGNVYQKEIRNYRHLSPGDITKTYIVGVSFNNRQDMIRGLSEDEHVLLVRRPNNSHDSNAIEVCIFTEKLFRTWDDNQFEMHFIQTGDIWTEHTFESIGYIRKEMAAYIAPFFDKYSPKLLPNLGKIIHISTGNNKPIGVEIQFRIPNIDNINLVKTLIEVQGRYMYPF